jgi:hypothetical protein
MSTTSKDCRRSLLGRRLVASFVFWSVYVALPVGRQRPVEAWWLSARFSPTATTYESLPVTKLDPSWVKVSFLDYDILPRDSQDDVGWMRRDGFVFRVDNFFVLKGATNRVSTGVYEDRTGRRGRFLLVLQKSTGGGWQVAFLHKEPGEAGFSVLRRKSGNLYWGTCLQCDEFVRLVMKHGRFTIEPVQ